MLNSTDWEFISLAAQLLAALAALILFFRKRGKWLPRLRLGLTMLYHYATSRQISKAIQERNQEKKS